MGDWLRLLIPLIVVAVWILSHLAGGQQQNQKRPAPPRPLPPQDPDDGARPQRAAREMEQFLEEVRRRKQEVEEKSQPTPVSIAEEVQRPRPIPLPRRQDSATLEQRRRTVPIGAKRPQRSLEPVIVLQPLPVTATLAVPGEGTQSVAMPRPGVEIPQAPQANQALPPPPAAPQALNRPEVMPTHGRQTAAMKMVRELLKNRQTLRAAFLLREVFDPPLSKRRRR